MDPMVSGLSVGDFEITTVVTRPPYYENCYLVHHKPSGALSIVDPGGDEARILAAIKQTGAKPQDILLTHGHPDHIGAVAELEQALGIPTRAHEDERPLINEAQQWASALMGMKIGEPQAIEYFTGEPTLSIGDQEIRVVHTPGHSPGGVCFVIGGFAMTGDTLFAQGVGRTDLPGGDGQTLRNSIDRFLGSVPQETVLFSGHGPQWTAGEAVGWWHMMADAFI